MAAKARTSRRLVVSALVDMLEAGKSSKEVARILAAYLVESGRVRDVELYLRDIELAVADRFGVATARVSSARSLSDKTREQIKKLVKTSVGAKEVEMVETTDPGLIGGVVIQTADAELDSSVRTKLRNLRSI